MKVIVNIREREKKVELRKEGGRGEKPGGEGRKKKRQEKAL